MSSSVIHEPVYVSPVDYKSDQKSWKKRFFVLSKTGEKYHLSYYRNHEKKGKIDLSRVSKIDICPENHQMWNWIQENFKCSSASVLLLRVEDFMPKRARDYFLIGENSDEVDQWHKELLKVTQTSENTVQITDDSLQQKTRSDDDSDDMEEQPDTPVRISDYIDMASVETADAVDSSQDLCNEEHNKDKDSPMPRVSECKHTESLFHKGDQILAFNDVLIDSVEEIEKFTRRLSKDEGKAWKRRFFVLYKTGEETYHLAYYRNNEKRDKPLRKIDLSNEEVDKWEKELLKVIRTLGNKVRATDDSLQRESRLRAISDPIPRSPSCDEGTSVNDLIHCRLSAPTFAFRTTPYSHYAVPSSLASYAPFKLEDFCSDDDDDDEDEPEENAEHSVEYMDMASVPTATKAIESSHDLCNAADNQKKESSMRRNSAELRCSKGSLTDLNGNFNEINKSETPEPVEKEICVKLIDLRDSFIFTKEQGKLCLSECKKNKTSHMFHKGDHILAFNDLLIDSAEEIQEYLKKLSKDEKSWKRRFFVLAKTGDSTHMLNYYRNDEKDSLIKSIDVSTITKLLNTCPTTHPAIEWICKTFKCSSCCVLLMNTENPKEKIHREYLLIGENSAVADGWYNALFQVQKHPRYISHPVPLNMNDHKSTDYNSHDTEQNGGNRIPPLPPKRKFAPADVEMKHNECHQPSDPSALEIKQDDSAGKSSPELSPSERTASTEESLLDCVTKAFEDLRTQQTPSMEKETLSEKHIPVEKEICLSLEDLNGVIFTDEAGRPRVSECRQIETTCLFHKGDQILAVNDLLTYTVEDIQLILRKLNKHEVKLTVLRHPDSIPFHSDHTY
ncbi:Pleckstrin -like proteiny domain-containing family S member 1 [Triplophysa tibetana]|uniref:Pleckstrin-like proteiny domain-containing family S member 1 n=1 Tax=Triplophysa tibetana TaxID=1572043 RepID=A0A5A9PT42_9TELE|nr:Pleckstrin -like proteiny domain-containing family S member 1 [Triplophysa tibetana]